MKLHVMKGAPVLAHIPGPTLHGIPSSSPRTLQGVPLGPCTESRAFPGFPQPPGSAATSPGNLAQNPVCPSPAKTTGLRGSSGRLSRKAITEAFTASLRGETTDEHREVLRKVEQSPEALFGLSKADHQGLLNSAEIIHAETESQEFLVAAQALIYCGLPYKPLLDSSGKPITHYKRTARTARGSVTLTVAAQDPDIPLPFGKDRLALAWVQTKAKKQGDPLVRWESAREFFEVFGLDGGGKEYRLFRETWERLSNAVFTIRYEGEEFVRGRLIPLLEDYDLPTHRDRQQESGGVTRMKGLPYFVRLSPTLWKHLQESPVPLRWDVMRHFRNEPKAWDFVSFICYRAWTLEMAGVKGGTAVARIPWQELLEQLGTEDKDEYRLRHTLKRILDRLKVIWPECRADFMRGGLFVIERPVNALHPVKPR